METNAFTASLFYQLQPLGRDNAQFIEQIQIRDANGFDATIRQISVARAVFGLPTVVHLAVNLDAKTRLGAVEVQKIWTDRHLRLEEKTQSTLA